MSRVDEPAEGPRKQKWADHESDRAQAADRALQFALFSFAHMMRHDSLRGGKGNIPLRNHGNLRHIHRAISREPLDQHSERAEKLANAKSAALGEPGDVSTSINVVYYRRSDPDNE